MTHFSVGLRISPGYADAGSGGGPLPLATLPTSVSGTAVRAAPPPGGSRGRLSHRAGNARAAHAALVKLHGIGPWTADIYLLFCLGHADAFPAGDLAVQEAVRIAFNLRKRPDAKALTRIAEAWRPWRGVAAHLFWAYYHVVKHREGISLQAKKPTAKKPTAKTKRTKTTGRTKKNG